MLSYRDLAGIKPLQLVKLQVVALALQGVESQLYWLYIVTAFPRLGKDNDRHDVKYGDEETFGFRPPLHLGSLANSDSDFSPWRGLLRWQ